jgi:hypothetical protein
MFKRLFRRNRKIGGEIAFYNLADWWCSEFTAEEQSTIVNRFKPLGGSGRSLIEGDLSSSSQPAAAFLFNLAGWFKSADDRPLARKILAKAERILEDGGSALDMHFFLQQKIEVFYKDRQDPASYRAALQACRDQIAMAPRAANAFLQQYKWSPLPSHRGYEQLAIALEKEGLFQEVIDICGQAKLQGWAGNWDKRIERCSKKLAKA